MARQRTHVPDGIERCKFSSRNFRRDLLDQLRVAAAWDGCALEEMLNRALAAGLPIVKVPALKKYKARKAKAA
jgi:hypothetical protein